MADLNHQFGSDLSFGPSGDLALVAGSPETVQRLLRRLLTNLQEYIWHTRYGAGLGKYVGETVDDRRIQGVILRQVNREKAVARTPASIVTVNSTTDGYVYVHIQYADKFTNQSQTVSFRVSS